MSAVLWPLWGGCGMFLCQGLGAQAEIRNGKMQKNSLPFYGSWCLHLTLVLVSNCAKEMN